MGGNKREKLLDVTCWPGWEQPAPKPSWTCSLACSFDGSFASWMLRFFWLLQLIRPPGWTKTTSLVKDAPGAPPSLRQAVLRHRPDFCCGDGLDLQVGPTFFSFAFAHQTQVSWQLTWGSSGLHSRTCVFSKAFIFNLLILSEYWTFSMLWRL